MMALAYFFKKNILLKLGSVKFCKICLFKNVEVEKYSKASAAKNFSNNNFCSRQSH